RQSRPQEPRQRRHSPRARGRLSGGWLRRRRFRRRRLARLLHPGGDHGRGRRRLHPPRHHRLRQQEAPCLSQGARKWNGGRVDARPPCFLRMIDTNAAFHVEVELASMGGAMKVWAICVLTGLLAACAGRVSEARASPEPLAAVAGEWVEIAPAPARIEGRLIEATCADYPGADPAYKFWARRGTENRLVVYFDGGGACWDDVTCAVPRLAGSRGEG